MRYISPPISPVQYRHSVVTMRTGSYIQIKHLKVHHHHHLKQSHDMSKRSRIRSPSPSSGTPAQSLCIPSNPPKSDDKSSSKSHRNPTTHFRCAAYSGPSFHALHLIQPKTLTPSAFLADERGGDGQTADDDADGDLDSPIIAEL